MSIRFTKMHGLGNDFMVIDAVNQSFRLDKAAIAALANRYTGIGFDQCLLIEKSNEQGVDFFYRIFNADGTEVGQCGNGARCLALFAQHYQLTNKKQLTIATNTTRMQLQINADNSVTVNFGRPKFEKNMQAIHVLSVGNPHAVTIVDDVSTAPVLSLGAEISNHPQFPEQINAGFCQIVSPDRIKLRVFERGSGETKACGSGAVAAAAVGRMFYHLADTIQVELPGGTLQVHWPDMTGDIFLTGTACFVYEGMCW